MDWSKLSEQDECGRWERRYEMKWLLHLSENPGPLGVACHTGEQRSLVCPPALAAHIS